MSSAVEGRKCIAILLFSGNAILYAMRVNLSVAIVAMVGSHDKKTFIHSNDGDKCPLPPLANSETQASILIYKR